MVTVPIRKFWRPGGSMTNFSLETQTEGSRKTSKARTWRENWLRKVVMSFHLVVGSRWRYGGQKLGGGFPMKLWEGAQHLTAPSQELWYSLHFGPVSLSVTQHLPVSKWAEHRVWLLYSTPTAHKAGISRAYQRVQLRTQSTWWDVLAKEGEKIETDGPVNQMLSLRDLEERPQFLMCLSQPFMKACIFTKIKSLNPTKSLLNGFKSTELAICYPAWPNDYPLSKEQTTVSLNMQNMTDVWPDWRRRSFHQKTTERLPIPIHLLTCCMGRIRTLTCYDDSCGSNI